MNNGGKIGKIIIITKTVLNNIDAIPDEQLIVKILPIETTLTSDNSMLNIISKEYSDWLEYKKIKAAKKLSISPTCKFLITEKHVEYSLKYFDKGKSKDLMHNMHIHGSTSKIIQYYI